MTTRLGAGCALVAATSVWHPGTVSAQAPNQFIGFGDSTMDSGYFRYGATGGSPGLPPGAPSDTIDKLIQATVAAGGSGAFLGPGVVDTTACGEVRPERLTQYIPRWWRDHLQLADCAERDLLAGGECRAGRTGTHRHHSAADRSVRSASRTEWRQRLGQRRADSLSFTNAANFPNASGTPFGGTVGADYRTQGGAILGMAVTAGSQNQGFSTGGHFTQTGEALSLYAAYSAGPLWGNAIASYGLLQNSIAREVAIGNFIDQNDGNADGHSLALALRGGYDFHIGAITTGPVAGAVLQQVRIDGLTETGTSGLSALSFGNQTRGSEVSQLGWRGSVDLGNWQPFADLEWNHEFADKNRTITTSLTSIAAPSWSADAIPIAANWATASVGVSYKVSPQVIVAAAASAMFASPQASSYGGELAVNVSF